MSGRPLRVAHVGDLHRDKANGVYATSAGLADHLPNEGVTVEFWHLSRKVRAPSVRNENGVEVVDLPRFRLDKASLFGLPRATRATLRERAKRVDVIHLHSVYQVENIAVSQLGLGKPLVLTPNGGYSAAVSEGRSKYLKALWRSMWEDRLVNRCAALHAVSPSERARLCDLFPAANVVMIPNAVPVSTVRVASAADPSGHFLFVGRLAIDHKGLDLLIRGYALAAQIRAQIPGLVLAGPDFRGSLARLEKLVDELDLSSRVKFIGPVFGEAKEALSRTARAFVHTSRWEGLPFAALEAMALGLPLIVTPGSNLAEAVTYLDCGMIVEPNVESIAAGLVRMSELLPDSLAAMGNAGLRTMRDLYTWHAVAPAVAALYRGIIE